jgi:hypothetical protein
MKSSTESKFPVQVVRIRAYMAHDYLLTNQIDKAKELLEQAESLSNMILVEYRNAEIF